MRATLGVLALLAASGCSLWNRPQPWDAGALDAPIDAAADAGVDAPSDAGADAPPPRPRETLCTDGLDGEDRDGLTDCADPDCASDVDACCSAGRPGAVIDEAWCTGVSSDWARRGTLTPTDTSDPCFLSGTGGVGSLVHRTCVPLVSGAVIRARLDWAGACPTCEALIALSPVGEAGPSGLLEDLGLRLHEDADTNLVLDLTRAGRVLGTLPEAGRSLSGEVEATLTLFPAVDEAGLPVLRATLLVAWDEGRQTAELTPLDALEHPLELAGPALGCDVAPGLFLGVQTRGTAARMGAVSAQPQQCSNPGTFRPAGLPPGFPGDAVWLEAADLGLGAAPWTSGGVGAGTSVPLRSGSMVAWHWFVDGSNLNRANDLDRALDFSFGGAFADQPGLASFSVRAAGAPLAGHASPTCTTGGTDCGVYDFREPVVFLPRTPDGAPSLGRTAYAVWVSRADDGTSTLVRDAFSDVANPAETLSSSPGLIATDCDTPSHPAVLSPDPTGEAGHLLLFVCGAEVWAVELDAGFAPRAGTETMLFTADRLGFPRGILDVDGAVFGGVYRVWVAGRDARGLTRVALTEARIPDAGAPAFVPFGGNPILSIDDPVFTRGPDRCMGTCRITGVGVAREPGPIGATQFSPRVRVLVSVTEEGAAVRHAIVPLEQWMP